MHVCKEILIEKDEGRLYLAIANSRVTASISSQHMPQATSSCAVHDRQPRECPVQVFLNLGIPVLAIGALEPAPSTTAS